MSVGIFKKILSLEVEILQRGTEMSTEEAHEFCDQLLSYHKDYAKRQNNFWKAEKDKSGLCEDEEYLETIEMATLVEKKIYRMQEWLRRFFEPVSPIKGSKKDPPVIATSPKSLLQKQKFYIQMIDLLEPEGELSSKQAELRYEHVSQAYEKFTSNQSEIMGFVENTTFDDQVEIFKAVQQKVLSLQETLKEISSEVKSTILPESKVTEHFNQIERPNVIADSLDLQYKKRKSLIEEIELIESKKDQGAAEAEILHNHVSESFVKNQARIVTDVSGNALDEELKISREINEKMMSLQTELKGIFAPVASLTLAEPKLNDESVSMNEKSETPVASLALTESKLSDESVPMKEESKNIFVTIILLSILVWIIIFV